MLKCLLRDTTVWWFTALMVSDDPTQRPDSKPDNSLRRVWQKILFPIFLHASLKYSSHWIVSCIRRGAKGDKILFFAKNFSLISVLHIVQWWNPCVTLWKMPNMPFFLTPFCYASKPNLGQLRPFLLAEQCVLARNRLLKLPDLPARHDTCSCFGWKKVSAQNIFL